MIGKFEVLVNAHFLSEEEKEVAIRCFSNLYHNVTPKHQRRISMNIIGENVPDRLMKIYELPESSYKTFNPLDKQSAFEQSSLLLHPSKNNFKNVLPEALSYGLSLIVRENELVDEYVDISCGMTVEFNSPEQLIEDFSQMLHMLYFDQEVLKILKKGALKLYEQNFSWGLKEFRKSAR